MTDDLRSHDAILSLLKEQIRDAGSQIKWSLRKGVNPSLVSQTITRRIDVPPSIAQALGFEPVTMYAPLTSTKKRRAS